MASAAPPAPSPEDRYVAARDAAIAKFSPIYDAGKFDDAAKKAEEAAFADLKAQMTAILGEPGRKGFGPAKLNIETFYKGDEGARRSSRLLPGPPDRHRPCWRWRWKAAARA
jgi:hypothetical protein